MAPSTHARMPEASQPLQAMAAPHMPAERSSSELHFLLSHLSQLPSNPAQTPPQQTHPESTPTNPDFPLHQQILQKAQVQHHALHWLIKICADLALGSFQLPWVSSQASGTPMDANPAQTQEVGQWVLMWRLLRFLDGYAQDLKFSVEDVVPGHKPKRASMMERNILLHLTAVADATGRAQR